MIKTYTFEEKFEMIYKGVNLEEFVCDEDWPIREAVAETGEFLEILVNDEDWMVRAAVARQGYGLDKLVNDKNWAVRAEVLRKGYGYEILVHDECRDIREEVLIHGFGIEILKYDKDEKIRSRALRLENSKTYVVSKNFGTYDGNLFLYVSKDKYEIISGCHSTNSLEEWYLKYLQRMDYDESEKMCEEQANELVDKMKKLIETV